MKSKLTHNYLPEFFALSLRRNRPAMVTVNLTGQCNQQCIYCEIGVGNESIRSGKLTYEDMTWILDEMAKSGIRKISLCGGEPFLFKGIEDIVAYASSKNIRTSITTNGMTVHALPEKVLDILKESGTEINISVDSFDEEINALTRGSQTALPNALGSIKRLQEKEIPLTLLTVISNHNYHTLYELFVRAHNLNIRQVLFQPVIYFSNYPDRQAIENKSRLNVPPEKTPVLLRQLKRIFEFERHHRIKSNVYRIYPWISHYLSTAYSGNGDLFFDRVLKKFYCREVDAIIDISYDGGLQPCGLHLSTVSIHRERERGLLSLWEEATKPLKDSLERKEYPGICNGCCHHFSRNMMASLLKYPLRNRKALLSISPFIIRRTVAEVRKKMITLHL